MDFGSLLQVCVVKVPLAPGQVSQRGRRWQGRALAPSDRDRRLPKHLSLVFLNLLCPASLKGIMDC